MRLGGRVLARQQAQITACEDLCEAPVARLAHLDARRATGEYVAAIE